MLLEVLQQVVVIFRIHFLGLFTEDGLQITDSNGYIIANNIKFDENNILKLYAKYN